MLLLIKTNKIKKVIDLVDKQSVLTLAHCFSRIYNGKVIMMTYNLSGQVGFHGKYYFNS